MLTCNLLAASEALGFQFRDRINSHYTRRPIFSSCPRCSGLNLELDKSFSICVPYARYTWHHFCDRESAGELRSNAESRSECLSLEATFNEQPRTSELRASFPAESRFCSVSRVLRNSKKNIQTLEIQCLNISFKSDPKSPNRARITRAIQSKEKHSDPENSGLSVWNLSSKLHPKSSNRTSSSHPTLNSPLNISPATNVDHHISLSLFLTPLSLPTAE